MVETWKQVVGVAGYEVSDRGRVRSVDRTITNRLGVTSRYSGKMLRAWPIKRGHLQVNLGVGQPRRHVHALVLEAFVGPCPKGYECRHLNGDPQDNRWPENLEWSSASRNQQDKKFHGTLNTPYSLDVVRAIKQDLRRYAHYGAISEIARRHGVPRHLVDNIKNGHCYADIE